MTIEKNNKVYTVKELKHGWKLIITFGSIIVDYKLSKTDCPTLDDLKKFVAENSAF